MTPKTLTLLDCNHPILADYTNEILHAFISVSHLLQLVISSLVLSSSLYIFFKRKTLNRSLLDMGKLVLIVFISWW